MAVCGSVGLWVRPRRWEVCNASPFPILRYSHHPQTDRPTDPQTHTAVTPAHAPTAVEEPPLGSLEDVGHALFGPFALPFEIASLILLAAIVGAVVLARRRSAQS